jgi:hypothetical protein
MKNPVIGLYAITTVALLMQFIPVMAVQIVSACALAVLFLALPLMRQRAPAESALSMECRYLFRTMWIWSALLFFGLIIAGYLVSQSFTLDQVATITQNLARGNLSDDATRRFTHLSAMAIGPSFLFFALRLGLGWYRILRTRA